MKQLIKKAPIDVREHIKNLEVRGLLVRVKRPKNKDTEIHPIVRWQFHGASVKRTERILVQEEAELALRGEYYKTGDKVAERRIPVSPKRGRK
jgi:hypothetical protein